MHTHEAGWGRRLLAVALIGLSAACAGDDDSEATSGGSGGHGGAVAGTGAGQPSGGAGVGAAAGHAAAGAAGVAAPSGGSSGGAGAQAAPGAGGSKPSTALCDPACASGEHCELVQVTCIRAPCPPQPMCKPDASMSTGGSGGASGASCGSRGQAQCPTDQFCQYPAGGDCGAADGGGQCQTKPQVCTQIYQPVCGCDGQTYSSSCNAASAGVSVQKTGECAHAATGGGSDCDPRKVTCGQGTPKCSGGQVPSVVNGCYAGCVDIEACACDSPDACPLSDEYTCHMSAAHCGPYVT